jgi:hypothetical protein
MKMREYAPRMFKYLNEIPIFSDDVGHPRINGYDPIWIYTLRIVE